VPDIYQGDEVESRSLVDPDNRRPVNWDVLRQRLRDRVDPKLDLIRRVLDVRDDFGGYMPIDAGPDCCAFRRGPRWLVVVPLRRGATKWIQEADGLDDVLPDLPVGLFTSR
jgi:(1->4)-alpha-D-glucan 1-alpha-D-glucosylmutase